MNRAWHLSSRPIGLPTLDNFALRALPDGPLDADQLRVRNLWLSVDPYMRGRMNDAKSYAASFQIDQPMRRDLVGAFHCRSGLSPRGRGLPRTGTPRRGIRDGMA